MKYIFALGFLFIMSLSVSAQKKSVVGKWKISSINSAGTDLDLEHPDGIKKMLADEMKKEGKEADSATVEQTFTTVIGALKSLEFEFTNNGLFLVTATNMDHKQKTDSLTYTVDYSKNLVKTTSNKNGTPKTNEMAISFDKEYLVLNNAAEKQVLKLKKE